MVRDHPRRLQAKDPLTGLIGQIRSGPKTRVFGLGGTVRFFPLLPAAFFLSFVVDAGRTESPEFSYPSSPSTASRRLSPIFLARLSCSRVALTPSAATLVYIGRLHTMHWPPMPPLPS